MAGLAQTVRHLTQLQKDNWLKRVKTLSDLTEDTGHKAEGEVWCEQSKEPWGGVQAGADLLLLQVAVQIPVVVMEQPRQLVHLNLGGEKVPQVEVYEIAKHGSHAELLSSYFKKQS